MKKLTTYVMTLLLATLALATAAPDEAAMMAKETAAWQAFKDKDEAGFRKVVDHDMVGVYPEGINGMQGELDGMKKWDMKSFKIGDFKGHSDEKDVFVTSYTVTIVGTMAGKDASGTYNAGSVWKQENGQWLAIFHTNAQKKE